MNDFEPKYIKISSRYLDEKMKSLGIKESKISIPIKKKDSLFKRVLKKIFKS